MPTNSTSSESAFTEVLAEIYRRLVQLERTIGALADATEDAFISWGFPQADAANARDALRMASSLTDTALVPPDTDPIADATADSLADLTRDLHRELITASEKASDAVDKLACLTAALHTGRLLESLR
ncbi:hypothetical protein [Thermomonospora cellulosilytica]|uniref:Uncharacterized protein n=1 Tax=Thermomonospora cellulosilytica TaxID=1411118 RepID=A0A7W3MVX2_9ACTN|nr:hypothetical protein [Thermomonospora cellulosilytica]MBA9002861.1 hypothetical protein [Thermomonospora cellulosilytica]